MFSRVFNSFQGDPTMADECALPPLSRSLTTPGQMFLEGDRFCVRMCDRKIPLNLRRAYCPHIYDEMGVSAISRSSSLTGAVRVERAR